MEMTYGSLALKMPSNYVVMDAQEMTYVEGGGLYFSNASVVAIVATICANPVSAAIVTNAVRTSAVFIAAKLGALLGPIGWAIGGATAAYVVTQATVIGERLFTALVHRKGVEFTIGWQWGIVPVIEGTIR